MRCCPRGTLSSCRGCLRQAGRCPQGYTREREGRPDGPLYFLVHLQRVLNSSSFELPRKGSAEEIKKMGAASLGRWERKEGRKGEASPIHCYHPLALPAPWGLKRWLVHGHRHRSCRSTATGSMRPAGRNSNCTERSGLPSSFQPKWPTAVTTRSKHKERPEALLSGPPPCLLCG